MSKKTVLVYKTNETVIQSIYKDIVTAVMVAFCVYISQGSTFWTFITGSMFLFFLLSRVSSALNNANEFKSKSKLKAWVDSLPDDEATQAGDDSQ